MNEIPDDIREKIGALWYEAMAESSPAPFARAILAERDRCARIANGAWLATMDAEASAVAMSIFDEIVDGA
jgi:hypothetical protein